MDKIVGLAVSRDIGTLIVKKVVISKSDPLAYFIRDNEIHYEVAASPDKDFIVIEGATHGITPCVRCEQSPGQYSNSVKNFFDYVAKWVNARF